MKYLVERRDALTPTEWRSLLDIDDIAWTDLVEKGVFEPSAGETLRILFVGLMSLPKELFVVLPKYASLPSRPRDSFNLQGALSHYFARLDSRRAVQLDLQHEVVFRDNEAFTEYQVWLTLRAWYREHGPYLSRRREFSDTWGSAVHWPRTIGRSAPMHGEDQTLYHSPIMARSSRTSKDVTNIQFAVLDRLSSKYGMQEDPPLTLAHRSEFATLAGRLDRERPSFALRVRRELASAYRTDEIVMLSALHDWLRGEQYGRHGPIATRLYGTSRFEYVWEDACKAVFGNRPDVEMLSPYWTIDDHPPRVGGAPRADIWTNLPNGRLAVLDAKYYWPLPTSVPGWADIVKQLYYADASTADTALVNGFLFPDPGANAFRRRGRVDIRDRGGLPDPRFEPIAVYGVQPDALFASYLDGRSASDWLAEIALTA